MNKSEEYYEKRIAHLGGTIGQIWEVCKDVKQDILQEKEAVVLIREITEWGMDTNHPRLREEKNNMKFKKKPVEIEAHRLVAYERGLLDSIAEWCGGTVVVEDWSGPLMVIKTLEGDMTAYAGDWIIKGVAGEFYPCRSDIFHQTYQYVGGE